MTVFSLAMPNCKEGKSHPPGVVDAEWMREIAIAGDKLGYHSLWTNELLQVQAERNADGAVAVNSAPVNYFDPLITIAYVAAMTERIRFTTATIVLPHHHPVLLSRQIATLDALTGGRITLGVGLGGTAESFRRLRADLGKVNRGAMMDEYIDALRLLWNAEPAKVEGQYVVLEGAQAFPKPVQNPLPIYAAGGGDAALYRVAERCEGWIDSHNRAEQLKEKSALIAANRAAGMPPAAIARQFYVALGETVEQARSLYESARGPLESLQVTDDEHRTIIGTPDNFVEVLSEYMGVADEICLIFYGATSEAVIEQARIFSERVAPRLEGRHAIPG